MSKETGRTVPIDRNTCADSRPAGPSEATA
jgi:hypothetical protein